MTIGEKPAHARAFVRSLIFFSRIHAQAHAYQPKVLKKLFLKGKENRNQIHITLQHATRLFSARLAAKKVSASTSAPSAASSWPTRISSVPLPSARACSAKSAAAASRLEEEASVAAPRDWARARAAWPGSAASSRWTLSRSGTWRLLEGPPGAAPAAAAVEAREGTSEKAETKEHSDLGVPNSSSSSSSSPLSASAAEGALEIAITGGGGGGGGGGRGCSPVVLAGGAATSASAEEAAAEMEAEADAADADAAAAAAAAAATAPPFPTGGRLSSPSTSTTRLRLVASSPPPSSPSSSPSSSSSAMPPWSPPLCLRPSLAASAASTAASRVGSC